MLLEEQSMFSAVTQVFAENPHFAETTRVLQTFQIWL
jgi:hypothetical protein